MTRMCELTGQEREFLDKVNERNLLHCKNKEQSLWNVCSGYLRGVFNMNLLDCPEDEIEEVLNKINPEGIVPVSVSKPRQKKSSNTLF